ncbi:MAG: glycosyl transferase [Actinobacteria bacterium HGW-Actinobacteria-10]|nr:MAG: glycosyl transferase [Actinobacteria bacterium HGW-Actinobacteria-10]
MADVSTHESGARPVSLKKRMLVGAPGLYRAFAAAYRGLMRLIGALAAARYIAGLALTGANRRRPAGDTGSGVRIVLDGCIFQDRPFGIARLWRAIMAEWSREGFANHVIVLDRGATAPRLPGFTYRRVPRLRAYDSASGRAMLEAVCRTESADLFISTHYTYPAKTRTLLYLYDMTPEMGGWDLDQPVWREKAGAIAHASAYACLSRNTLDDLLGLHPEVRDRPHPLVLPGVEPTFVAAAPDEVARLVRELDLPTRYYLFIGHRDHYKNAELLFDTLPLLQDVEDIGLLLIGGAPRLESSFAERPGRIPTRIANLSDDELRAAYGGAAALLYLSRYEGFGLPILEAMACGCPVITCRNSSLPEAAGDAALYVDSDNPESLRQAMLTVLEPTVRADLIRRGFERAPGFRWRDSAEALARAIRDTAADGNRVPR